MKFASNRAHVRRHHAAPAARRTTSTGQIIRGFPPWIEVRLSAFPLKNATDWLFGDRKGKSAPSVSGSGEEISASKARSQSVRRPPGPIAEKKGAVRPVRSPVWRGRTIARAEPG